MGEAERPLRFLADDEYVYWSAMPGFLLPSAAERLYRAARDVRPDGAVVELGSFAGKSLVCLARGVSARSNGMAGETPILTAIDIGFHDGWPEAVARFDLATHVTPIERGSIDVANEWNQPIAMLYIDADHGFGHARADFVAWEPFVLPDGIIALDDTVGFYPGCSLQVQMAVADGRFELLDDVGGVTFLQKKTSLFDGVGQYPVRRHSAFATVAAASAWTGAMDPDLRLPNPTRFILPDEMIETRLATTLASLDTLRSNVADDLRDDLLPTVTYVEAVTLLHRGAYPAAQTQLESLTDRHTPFFHYDLPVSPLARLRQAQLLDLAGDRAAAVRAYEVLGRDCDIPGIQAATHTGASRSYVIPQRVTGRLLRDYVLDSPLGPYRRSGPRA